MMEVGINYTLIAERDPDFNFLVFKLVMPNFESKFAIPSGK